MMTTAPPRREATGPDFVEALARGLDVIRVLGEAVGPASLSVVAERAGLARPTARRLLITLEALGYVRGTDVGFLLTPKVLELGTAHIGQSGLWDVLGPHLVDLSAATGESTSAAQLDGSDIVYTCRVAVPKIITLQVTIGTRFPALPTSLGKVLLADLAAEELEKTLGAPSGSPVRPRWQPTREERDAELATVRARGWALTDEQLAAGIRSAAAPVRDGSGRAIAAVNVSVHAAETSLETLVAHHVPLLLQAASAISADVVQLGRIPTLAMG
jgi:IclR family transcriptional regulator, pca regulon regulatory protein